MAFKLLTDWRLFHDFGLVVVAPLELGLVDVFLLLGHNITASCRNDGVTAVPSMSGQGKGHRTPHQEED